MHRRVSVPPETGECTNPLPTVGPTRTTLLEPVGTENASHGIAHTQAEDLCAVVAHSVQHADLRKEHVADRELVIRAHAVVARPRIGMLPRLDLQVPGCRGKMKLALVLARQ
eukprot:3925172-Prymnesium_polylepis.1